MTTFVQKDGTHMVPEGCTDQWVRLSDWSDYCKMCYRSFSNGANEQKVWTTKQKQANAKKSTMGCFFMEESHL
jgi:hypothetical protein